jgi:predicted HicB family RNase H-like nuclease
MRHYDNGNNSFQPALAEEKIILFLKSIKYQREIILMKVSAYTRRQRITSEVKWRITGNMNIRLNKYLSHRRIKIKPFRRMA